MATFLYPDADEGDPHEDPWEKLEEFLKNDVSPDAELPAREAWMSDANCLGTDTESWFDYTPQVSSRNEELNMLRRICSRCPAIESCRDYADRLERDSAHLYGFYAGETPKERRRRRVRDRGLSD